MAHKNSPGRLPVSLQRNPISRFLAPLYLLPVIVLLAFHVAEFLVLSAYTYTYDNDHHTGSRKYRIDHDPDGGGGGLLSIPAFPVGVE